LQATTVGTTEGATAGISCGQFGTVRLKFHWQLYFGEPLDSHIAYRAHAAPMTFPCHAVPLRVWNVSFSFDLHSAAVSDSHFPCHAHAMLRPFRSSQGHGIVRPSRGGLWATCPRSASSGYHAEFREDCYQKHTNLRCRWPVRNQTTFVMDEEKSGSSTLQKRRSVKLLD
jgi:hypothetical protein